jgi:polar amino acid transport system substrate-binding protein
MRIAQLILSVALFWGLPALAQTTTASTGAGAPAHGATLYLSVVVNNATHAEMLEMVKLALKRIGVTAVARPVPAARALVLADAGSTDGDLGRIAGTEKVYTNLVPVPEPIYFYQVTAYAYQPIDTAEGWESLRPHSICLRRGIRIFELRTEGMRRQVLDDEDSILRMLRSGGCQVALLERLNPTVMAAQAAQPPLLKLNPPLETVPLYIYLHKRHADLVPRLTAALRQMRADGTLPRRPD